MKQPFQDFSTSLLSGLGILFLISPVFLMWFIHGSYERYLWIIQAPYPFNAFGGGPFQIALIFGLIVIGIVCFVLRWVLLRSLK